MKYRQAYWYILDRRGGFVSLLLLSVCSLIPIIGQIVLLGYQGEVAVALDRDPDLRRHPKFKFDYFMDYLTRGIWPFLVQLIFAALMMPIMFGIIIAMFFAALPNNPQRLNNPPIGLFVAMEAAIVVVVTLFSLISVPMTFHAEFTGKFNFGGAFRFAVSFLKLVGGRAIVTGVVYVFLSWFVAILGLLCFCVGYLPALILVQMAGTHLTVQLYRDFLDRGGEPLLEYDPYEDDRDRDRRERDAERDDDRWAQFDDREDPPHE